MDGARRARRAGHIVGVVALALLAAGPAPSSGSAQGCDVQLVLDQPREGAELSGRAEVRGWAADRGATSGTGIRAMRLALVQPDDRPDAIAWQPVSYGLARPDLALLLGNGRSVEAGFSQAWSVRGTAPGAYGLRVEALSACGWTGVTRDVRVPAEQARGLPSQEVLVPLPLPEAALDPPRPEPSASTPVADPLARTPPIPYSVAAPLARLALTFTPLGADAVTLSWSAVEGAQGYAVYQADESALPPPGPGWPPAGPLGYQRVQTLSETTTTVSGLGVGKPYRFLVRALAPNRGEVAESDAVRVLLDGPANTLTATTAAGSVVLTWTPVPNAASYAVLIGPAGGSLQLDPRRAIVATTHTLVDPLPPGAYSFQVEARDGQGSRLTRSNAATVSLGANLASALPAGAAPAGSPPGGGAAAGAATPPALPR